jgi:hypothetical protein
MVVEQDYLKSLDRARHLGQALEQVDNKIQQMRILTEKVTNGFAFEKRGDP